MTATVFAELTADREQIVLMAGGQGGVAEVIAASKRLDVLTPLFTPDKSAGVVLTPVSWPTVLQLSDAFGNFYAQGPELTRWVREESVRRTAPGPLVYQPPAGLKLRAYQVDGARMIGALGRVLITDEPGTGKTITTIAGLCDWLGTTAPGLLPSGPVVVVCPASVVDSWVAAWQAWAPWLRTTAWRGSASKAKGREQTAVEARHALLGHFDVYVTSYELAMKDAPPASKRGGRKVRPLTDLLNPVAVVIDECHYIKNPTAARSTAVHRIAACATKQHGAVVALSGTPITTTVGDLWSTLHVLEPAYPARERWEKRYCMLVDKDYDTENLGLLPSREPEYRLTMLGQTRRVAKADVLPQLPRKVWSTRTVDLPADWRRAYDEFATTMLAELPDGTELSLFEQLTMFGHLTRLACAPCDVEVTFDEDPDPKTGEFKRHVSLHMKAPSWKVEALLEILAERRGKQTIVFAPSRQLVMLAGRAAQHEGYRVGFIVGGQSARDRTAAMDKFQAGESDLICVTTGAGGTGITLTAASTVVFLQRPSKLAESIQCEDRAHRIGSEIHESIEIIDIKARGTIDDRIDEILHSKGGQLADLLEDPRIRAELLGGSSRLELARSTTPPHHNPLGEAS